MTTSSDAAVFAIPELGPSLGRLADASDPGRHGALGVTLEDLRLKLTTRLFELAGAGRHFLAAGDYDGAVQSLGRVAWLGVWDETVKAAAARVTEAINAHVQSAAAESRLPAKRLRRLLLSPEDTGAIAARFGAVAAEFVAALDALETTAASVAAAREASRGAAWHAWQDALRAAARRLESAWLALETEAEADQTHWQAEVARVRAWRRPRWPLWLITALVLAAVTYLGLVLGGQLPAPRLLRALVDAWGWGSGRWI